MNRERRHFLQVAGAGLALAAGAHRALAASTRQAFQSGLGALYSRDFAIGTALSNSTLYGKNPGLEALVAREFTAITAENAMKWEEVHPQADVWDWPRADRLVDFGSRHNKYTIGHTLVWHSQIPESVFIDGAGKPRSAARVQGAMDDHIRTLVGRYRGRVRAWDVVNEGFTDAGEWRDSHWYTTLGEDYFPRAFHLAHEVDPKAELLYNDYNMHLPAKRDFALQQIQKFRKQGMPIHGVGMQAHVHLDEPAIAELEASIEAIAAAGLDVHITELDVDVLPRAYDHMGAEISTNFEYSEALNPFSDKLPAQVADQLASRYESLFTLFLKHRDKIRRVSLWGTTDAESWKNDWPVVGRTNYPLMFDRLGEPKKAYYSVAGLRKSS